MSNLTLLIGGFSTGKSTTFARLMKEIQGKCLVLDPGGAPAYADFPELPAANAWKYVDATRQGKTWRIQDTGDRSREISLVFGYNPETKIYSKGRAYLNGNLFLEDAGAYLDSNLTREVKSRVKAMKQHGLNLFLSYHSIDEISTDVLRMSPSIIMLKKTGDVNVFSDIEKVKKLGNYSLVMQAFYRAKFRGLSPRAVVDQLPPEDLFSVCRDLRIPNPSKLNPRRDIIPEKDCLNLATALSRWANSGKTKVSEKEREAGMYYTETVILR